jgi:hypothetical protein
VHVPVSAAHAPLTRLPTPNDVFYLRTPSSPKPAGGIHAPYEAAQTLSGRGFQHQAADPKGEKF